MIMQAPLVMLMIQTPRPALRRAGNRGARVAPGRFRAVLGRLRAAKRGGGGHEVRYASTSLSWAAGQPVLPVTLSLR